jgi:hypothetical protein
MQDVDCRLSIIVDRRLKGIFRHGFQSSIGNRQLTMHTDAQCRMQSALKRPLRFLVPRSTHAVAATRMARRRTPVIWPPA